MNFVKIVIPGFCEPMAGDVLESLTQYGLTEGFKVEVIVELGNQLTMTTDVASEFVAENIAFFITHAIAPCVACEGSGEDLTNDVRQTGHFEECELCEGDGVDTDVFRGPWVEDRGWRYTPGEPVSWFPRGENYEPECARCFRPMGLDDMAPGGQCIPCAEDLADLL